MKKLGNIKLFSFVVVLLIALYGSGCEYTFQPLEGGDDHDFTMYGALDLHADTQWVRVMPIGERLIPRSKETNVKVELVREKTGETIVMNDSLFLFGGEARVWNYWATESLHPQEVYTVRAENPEGEQSSATVTIPSPLPIPIINEDEGTVTGTSNRPLVTADVKLYVRLISEVGTISSINTYTFSLLDKIQREPNGEYFFRYNIGGLLFQELDTRSGYRIVRKTLVVAKASEDWPDLSDLTQLEISIPNIASNVENGTGYIAGIAKREVPLQSCYDDEGDLIPCREVNSRIDHTEN